MTAALAPVAASPITSPAQKATPAVTLRDVSLTPRYGCKGPAAADWLASLGLSIPAAPNRWLPTGSGLIARLGKTEFLIDADASAIARLEAATPPAGVAIVLHQDVALELSGPGLPALLLQTCNVNFAAQNLADAPVVLTSMVGVTVTVIPGERNGQAFYRVWADGSYGDYLWETLHEVAGDIAL
jgi:sarcosine oxidase subunit gamma